MFYCPKCNNQVVVADVDLLEGVAFYHCGSCDGSGTLPLEEGVLPVQAVPRRHLKKLLAEEKQFFSRGLAWVGILLNFGIITANIKLFEPVIFSVIPWSLRVPFYLSSFFGFFILCRVIGKWDLHKGIWKEENNYNVQTNEYIAEQLSKIREMHEIIVKK